ncbi:spatacsin-like isoform X2 [Penaeus japonicus]|uniref:spatacsin-like isoform X2 n=1 Tax=Penaeus japonicus TaxID=27405 RepID=UPI001C7123DF|nr:spatacsin-like isoform X2 [Penaeus japonicus]
MSAHHRNVNKLVVVKKLTDVSYPIEQVLRAELESNNKGFLTLLGDGRLILTAWINKKVTSKIVEDASDACWQRGSESEVIIVCHNGALVRYSLHFDTGLSCSLQLSAPSLLSLIREKDSSVRSLRSPKLWGHTIEHILLQPQSDRLVLLATNAGGRPTAQGVLRTPPLRTAHLSNDKILAQPVTGSDLYEYDTRTCKIHEIVNLGLQRMGSDFIEWGTLAASLSGDTVAVVDSERHLYVTNFRHRLSLGRRGRVNRSRVTLHQVIWPASLQPSQITQISLALSDSVLAVFCQTVDGKIENQHYLSFDVSLSSLNCHHCFAEPAAIIPGMSHQLPDLFLTVEGVAMLMDEDASISSLDSEIDLGELLGAMDDALKEQNMAKVTEVKAMIEQGLSVFLSSCNHQEGWLGMAEMRAQQYGQLANLLLSYIPQYAECYESYSLALALKDLARHHFISVREEMSNVLQYIDSESISQMVLQMTEQVSFYFRSVEQLQLPQEGSGHKELSKQHAVWGEKPMKDILEDALQKGWVKAAESYLQLKPWVYGAVTTSMVISTCIDIARQRETENSKAEFLMKMDDCYNEALKQILHSSDDLFEVQVLGTVLGARGLLSVVETHAVNLVINIHRTLPDLLTLPPQVWTELVKLGDASADAVTGPMTVKQVSQWTPLSMMLVMTDLYACTADPEILQSVDADVMWQYLLHQHDIRNLKKWILLEFSGQDQDLSEGDVILREEQAWSDPAFRSPRRSQPTSLMPEALGEISETKHIGPNLFSGPQYGSEFGSSPQSQDELSIDSTSLGPGDPDTWSVQSFEVHDRRDTLWSVQHFKPITQSMVDLVVIAKEAFVEVVLNILARFGVFITKEKKDPQLLLRRLLVSGAFELVSSFKGNHSCQVLETDIHSTLLKFFGDNDFILPAYDYVEHFSLDDAGNELLTDLKLPSWANLIVAFRKLGESHSKETIYDLSLKNLSLLSEKCQNPQELHLPAFLTMLFAPSNSLENFIKCDFDKLESTNSNEVMSLCAILSKHNTTPKQVIEGLSLKYPYLEKLRKKTDDNTLDVTMYDLLCGNVPYDIARLFTWQPGNKQGYDEDGKLPCFSDEELISSYGLQHSLDFMYYLREARPTYACAAIMTSMYLNKSKKKVEDVKGAIFGLALGCWPDRAISAACVAVLLMTGLPANPLRAILAAAFQILQARNESCAKLKWEKRQAQEHLITTEIKDLLHQLCEVGSRATAAKTILKMLEDCVMLTFLEKAKDAQSGLSRISDGTEKDGIKKEDITETNKLSKEHVQTFMEGMRLCMEFCCVYELSWPTRLLKHLAELDQWLLFLASAQIYKFPRDEVLKAAESFQSIALREHMLFALTHIYYYREGHEPRQRSKEGSRRARSSLYSRIGIKVREDSLSPTQSSDENPRSTSPSEPEVSIIDDALSFTTTETCHDFGIDSWLSYQHNDIYSILLTCHQRENSAAELVTAAVALNIPILCVFAGCYERHSVFTCLSVWLYTQLPKAAKKTLHQHLIKSEIYMSLINDSSKVKQPEGNCCRACDNNVLQAVQDDLKWILLAHISKGSVDVPIEGLRIFLPDSPMLSLLLAIKEVNGMCCKDKVEKYLSSVASALENEICLESDAASGRVWLTRTMIDIIGKALDEYITNSHLQCYFLSAITAISQQPPFSSHSVNWNLIGQLCKALGSVKHQVTFSDLLWCFETGELKTYANSIVSCLSEKRYFSEALSVSQLTSLPIFTIVCAQLRAEFEKNQGTVTESLSNLEDFLAKSHKRLCQESVPPEHAANCFISISKELSDPAMKYLCLQYVVIWSSKEEIPADLADMKENLEYEMWESYIQAFLSKESSLSKGMIKPPSHLGVWPWEGQDGTSPLDRKLIIKSAELKKEIVPQLIGGDEELKHEYQDKAATREGEPGSPDRTRENNDETQDLKEERERESPTKNARDKALQYLVDLCINEGMLITAYRILVFFHQCNKNMETLLSLLGLADGSEVEEGGAEEKEICAEFRRTSPHQTVGRKGRPRSRGISVCSSLSVISLDPEDEIGLKTPTLIKMSTELTHGRNTAERIVMLYRVAAALDLSYVYVIHHPTPITLVSLVLRLNVGGVIQLARDLIHALPVPQSSISSFLCEEAVATITAGPSATQRDRLFLWEELEMQWCELITLCEDPSSLGNQLLVVGQRIGSSHPDQVEKVHSMSVELVIRAHDCFTAASNMEGISTVLRTALSLTGSLLQHSQWSLMVRLLTGIGRYSEMSYVIDALREHDQFEPLLGRGSDPRGCKKGLDRALVHYLRSKYPEDTETLRLVALHFLLYSEVAEMWATDAEKAVEKVLEATVDLGVSCSTGMTSPPVRSTPNKNSTREASTKTTPRKPTPMKGLSSPTGVGRGFPVNDQCDPDYLHNADSKLLVQAMHSYAHAAQYYMQDQQLATAVEYSRQAELVALQTAHVRNATSGSSLRLLKLSPGGVRCVTTRLLRVSEAQLVGRAYNMSVDWGAALYQQFINKGDDNYLTEYLAHCTLSPEIVLDVIKKLEHDGVTKERQERVALLLKHVQEADVVYRVASQLGLRGTVDACLASASAPYLRDTVFTKGFTYGS